MRSLLAAALAVPDSSRASRRGAGGRPDPRRHRERGRHDGVDGTTRRTPTTRSRRRRATWPSSTATRYKTRAKIHKYAAVATLPLFATEFYLGQSIYNTPSDSKKNAHIAIGTGIIGLYAVQGVTGVWNLVEANKDPNGHKRRLIHGILMLASGAGFAITPMTAPGRRDRLEFGTSSASTHRAVAFTSIGIGTAGYLMMLFGGK